MAFSKGMWERYIDLVSMIERKDPKSAAEAKEAVEESLNHKLAQTGAQVKFKVQKTYPDSSGTQKKEEPIL